jgi:hypothetical protein
MSGDAVPALVPVEIERTLASMQFFGKTLRALPEAKCV